MDNLTPRQYEILKKYNKLKPRILILSGAKRSGKTFLNNLLFLTHIATFKDENFNFLILGATSGSIWRNVLNDWEIMLNKEFKLKKDGSFKLFGNNIFIFGGEKSDSWKKLRGMTSHGTYINEATALNKQFIQEAFSRTSGEGAKIFIDTNPDNPAHFIKKDYIDNYTEIDEETKINIMVENFKLDDNVFLNDEYVESIKATTPQGATYDRDILGLWVAQEGIVYRDFNEKIHIINDLKDIEIKNYYIGVDWGYDHYGALIVIGVDDKENYYIIETIAKRYKYYNDYWLPLILKKYREYNVTTIFCDSARPEYVTGIQEKGLNAVNAKKDKQEGINLVGGLFKRKKIFILKSAFDGKFQEEIYSYVWGSNDEPLKENDDLMDALRYVLYSLKKDSGGIAYLYES